MCENAADVGVMLPMTRVWKVVKYDYKYCLRAERRWWTGPYSATNIISRAPIRAIMEKGNKADSPYPGWRCFLKREDAERYASEFASTIVIPVVVWGRSRVATTQLSLSGFAIHESSVYDASLVLAEWIRFDTHPEHMTA